MTKKNLLECIEDTKKKQVEFDAFNKKLKDIYNFMEGSNRFREVPETHGRHFRLLDKQGNEKTTVYFKFAFGGWSIIDEHGVRQTIDSVETLEKYLK